MKTKGGKGRNMGVLMSRKRCARIIRRFMEKTKTIFNKKLVVIVLVLVILGVGGSKLFSYAKDNKKLIAINSLSLLNNISRFLPIEKDTKKEIEVLDKMVEKFTAKDDKEYTFMVLLQNNMELRPGGGFLGQYAIVSIKNGEVTSSFIEDANLLDQRIQANVPAPYPFPQFMQIKKWKFRDSNFSPDFATNVEKAKYFYRLSGRSTEGLDGMIAVNASVLNDLLTLTGPITVPGYNIEFNSDNAVLKLEEVVEKNYLLNPDLDTQNRKAIMKKMMPILIDKIFSVGNITKLSNFAHQEINKKNIMMNFTDPQLQSLIEGVHWDGAVSKDWEGDYLMTVDANMGALKSDYYIKRSLSYDIDLTQPKPLVTLKVLYQHTAQYGDWRTSDYHAYLRVYVPEGSNLLERKMVGWPLVEQEFGKTYFGFKVDVLIGGQTEGLITYELPERFSNKKDYKLLIQKQSGVGDVPVKVHVKTTDDEFNYEGVLEKDLKLEFQ